ncbi:hypothetical protein AHAS_Ahas13G0188400 [Arachis hypogaea]
MAKEVRDAGEEKSGEQRRRGRTGRCGDDAVSGPAETDSGEAVTMAVGGGWLGRGRERRGKVQRRRVLRGAGLFVGKIFGRMQELWEGKEGLVTVAISNVLILLSIYYLGATQGLLTLVKH